MPDACEPGNEHTCRSCYPREDSPLLDSGQEEDAAGDGNTREKRSFVVPSETGGTIPGTGHVGHAIAQAHSGSGTIDDLVDGHRSR